MYIHLSLGTDGQLPFTTVPMNKFLGGNLRAIGYSKYLVHKKKSGIYRWYIHFSIRTHRKPPFTDGKLVLPYRRHRWTMFSRATSWPLNVLTISFTKGFYGFTYGVFIPVRTEIVGRNNFTKVTVGMFATVFQYCSKHTDCYFSEIIPTHDFCPYRDEHTIGESVKSFGKRNG